MTQIYLDTLLFVVTGVGLLSLIYRDLFVSVILLSIFSFLSALLFYVSHAPDVAITEAAVGAGMTTFIFIWAVRISGGSGESRGRSRRLRLVDAIDILLAAGTGLILWIILPPIEGGPVLLRDYILSHGYEDIGALNLVSAVYLGYRAFDTIGETIVLLCAVSGSVYLLSKKEDRD